MQVLKTASSITSLFASYDVITVINIFIITIKTLKCRNKMNVNKETSNKGCHVSDFRHSVHITFS